MSKYLQAVEKLKNLYCPFCSGVGKVDLDDNTSVFCDECAGTGFDSELIPEITIGELVIWRDEDCSGKAKRDFTKEEVDDIKTKARKESVKQFLSIFHTGKSSSDKLYAAYKADIESAITTTPEEVRTILRNAGIIGEDGELAEPYRNEKENVDN